MRLVLPVFFALSGFLVAASLERNPLPTFLIFRCLRLVPALAVEIALSALILGPLFSTYGLYGYFSDGKLPRYFLNVVGWIHYELPGMFNSNPYPNIVNGSLWTVPFELECYISLVVLALLRVIYKPKILLLLIFAGGILLLTVSYLRQEPDLRLDSAVPGRVLILCFLAGTMIHAARDFVPYSPPLCFASVIISLAFLSTPVLYVFSPIPAAYATVWLGLQNIKKVPVLFSGDYSYGMYLYAFPIQQTVVLLLPGAGYWMTLILSLAATSCFAAFSWQCIEKPALRVKRLFSRR